MLQARRKRLSVGPADHGKRMSLDDFDRAIGREGYVYELNKGVIEVSDVPHPKHLAQLQELRNQLIVYQVANPDAVHTIAGSNEAKLLIGPAQSERHPDISVYLTPPPDLTDVWSLWVPAVVVEVVSPSSAKRDYDEKPAEYLGFGVAEYWIVDAARQQMTALVRWRAQWKEHVLKPGKKYSTRYLPGFALDLKRVFAAAK